MKEEVMSELTRWHPLRELRHELRRNQLKMDRFFGRWVLDLPDWPALAVSYPPVNRWEDDDFVYVEPELPGLKLHDIQLLPSGMPVDWAAFGTASDRSRQV